MFKLSAFLNVLQLLILIQVYSLFDNKIERESVRDTTNFVFLVHGGVSLTMIVLAFWNRKITANMIGFSLYSFAGSLSLHFINQQYLPQEDILLQNWSIILSSCAFCSLATSWWSVYQDKFQNLW